MRVTLLRLLGASLAVVLVVGCGKAEQPVPQEVAQARQELPDTRARELAKLGALVDELCACEDVMCGERVTPKLQAWMSAMTIRPDTDVATIIERLTRCSTKLASLALTAPTEPPPPSAPPLPEDLTPPFTTAAVLRAAQRWMEASHPDLTLRSLKLSYVDEHGVLDDEHGSVELQLAPVLPGQDPNRKLGAPIQTSTRHRQTCPRITFAKGTWTSASASCTEQPLLTPRCAVDEIWRRAIKKGGPREALAVLTLRQGAKQPIWQFQVSDPPRGVDFHRYFPDDCEVTVEQPAVERAGDKRCDPFTSRTGCRDRDRP